VDFRDVLTITIDPVDAKDFDDALSYQELDSETVQVGVHIADVSHFVRPGSELDREARERSFSVYLVDRTIPMLPEILSNNLCSLNPNVDRFAFSAVFDIEKKTGKVLKTWFGKTIINSDKRFSYEEAQDVIEKAQDKSYEKSLASSAKADEETRGLFEEELSWALMELMRLSRIFRQENKKNGAIEFETDEVKFDLDEKGKPIRVYKKERVETMKMIEEWMLLANRAVAEYISKKAKEKGGAGLFRIHDEPNIERLENLSIFIRALGHDFYVGKDGVSGKDINKMLGAIANHSSASLVRTAAIRSMAKAIYSAKNIGHFGLAFEYYTHFTSPIRRYPDLVVHRILQNYLTNGKISKNDFERFEKIGLEASDKEIVVQEAERDSIKYKQVEYMTQKIGQEFECTVSGVTEFGMFVEDPLTKAEGLIRLRDMEGDQFELDEKNYAVIGKNSKKKFTLGDSVRVKLMAADLDRKTLDFKLI
jgi:ribonuclease R